MQPDYQYLGWEKKVQLVSTANSIDRQTHPTCKVYERVAVFSLDFLVEALEFSGISSVTMREKGTNFWRRWAACGTLG